MVVIWIVMTFVFFVLRVLPGDFAAQTVANQFLAGANRGGGTPEDALAAARERLGMDDPLPVQYANYFWDILRGDFGLSFRTSEPALDVVLDAVPYTLQLGLMSIAIAIIVALPIGIISAVKQDTALDGGLRFFAVFFLAAPTFWIATLLSGWAVKYDAFNIDVVGHPGIWEDPWNSIQLFAIPALASGLAAGAIYMRFLRSQLLDVMRQDYVRTARSKGLSGRIVISRHVLRNALIPLVTVFGFSIANLLGGNAILEVMFNIPGMGNRLLTALLIRDVPVAQLMTLITVAILVMVNLLVDLSYFLIDPRVTVKSVEQ